MVTPEGKAALLEVNELPSVARLRKGAARRAVARGTLPSSASERAFDGEKEAVVRALLRFVAGVVVGSDDDEGASEVEAARAAGLKPLAEAVARGQRALLEGKKAREREREQKKGIVRRLARRLFFESAAGDAAAALLAAVCPRLLVFLAGLAACAGVAGPDLAL